MRTEIKERIERDIRDNPVLIYMKGTAMMPRCGFSAATVEALREAGASDHIHDVDVLADPELWHAVREFNDWPTIPQVFIDGEFIGGCDITRELLASGELATKVSAALDKTGANGGDGS